MNTLTQAVELSIEFNKEKEDLEEAKNLIGVISELLDTMETTEGQLDYFRGVSRLSAATDDSPEPF